ncbi:MAG: hypothetical protein R3E35_09235 [Rhodocyclaceae bacterium]
MGQVISAASLVAVSALIAARTPPAIMFVTLDVTLPLVDDLSPFADTTTIRRPSDGGLDLIAAAFTLNLLDISIAGGFSPGACTSESIAISPCRYWQNGHPGFMTRHGEGKRWRQCCDG